jgi:hypothetical protein
MGLLPSRDRHYLSERNLRFEEVEDGPQKGLVLPKWTMPSGRFDHVQADLLIMLPGGYPDLPPDMFYLNPWVRIAATQQFPRKADVSFQFKGINWQQWSRHNNEWRRGVDGIWTMLKRVEHSLSEAT